MTQKTCRRCELYNGDERKKVGGYKVESKGDHF